MDPLNKDISYRDTVIKNLRTVIKDLLQGNHCASKSAYEDSKGCENVTYLKKMMEVCKCEICLANHALATTSGWE